MQGLEAYLPLDRLHAFAEGKVLDEYPEGAVLFADISGFTPLTHAYVAALGPRSGAEAATQQLNSIYDSLIVTVHELGGSVVAFSGDGMLCWFDRNNQPLAEAGLRAAAAALFMQKAMAQQSVVQVSNEMVVTLAMKTAIICGRARRFVVGDPRRQLLDVLAGSTIERVGGAEQQAPPGSVLLDEEMGRHLTRSGLLTGNAWLGDNGSETVWQVLALTDAGAAWVAEWRGQAANFPSAYVYEHELLRPWLAPTIYERLVKGNEQYLAELRPAVALFIRFPALDYDLAMGATRDLDRFVQRVEQIVDDHEGLLAQLTLGDKGSYLYVAFGAPVLHEDDAVRAVAAALAILAASVKGELMAPLQIGIARGRARVGAYGSRERRTYGVQGPAVNLGARLMMLAEPGQLLLDKATAEACASYFTLLDLGTRQVKGQATPVQVYTAMASTDDLQERYRGDLGPSLQQLVGRDDELALLAHRVRQLQAGSGIVLRMEGSAGIGKTALLSFVTEQLREQGYRVIQAQCNAITRTAPYSSVRSLVARLLGLKLNEAIDTPRLQVEVEQKLAAYQPEWSVRAPLLGDLVNIPFEDNMVTRTFDAKMRQGALVRLLEEYAVQAARGQGFVVAIDDAQWLDEASVAVVAGLARAAQLAPILLLLSHRPQREEMAGLLSMLQGVEDGPILLQELSQAAVAEIVRNRLGGEVAPVVGDVVYLQTQGVPLFVEEFVAALCENGQVRLQRGRWEFSTELMAALQAANAVAYVDDEYQVQTEGGLQLAAEGLPESINELVLARLDSLPEEMRLNLKVASVIGSEFDAQLLSAVHPNRPQPIVVQADLQAMAERELLQVEQQNSRSVFRFRHHLAQEVTYQTLLKGQLQTLHEAVAHELEQAGKQEIDRLAHHYVRADTALPSVRTKALRCLDAAAQRAMADYANQAARRYVEQALELEATWPRLEMAATLYHLLGERAAELRVLQWAEEHAGVAGAALCYRWGEYFEAINEYGAAEETILRGITVAKDDRHAMAQGYNLLGEVARRYGHFDEARRYYLLALEFLGGSEPSNDRDAVEAQYGLGIASRQQGNYEEAVGHLQVALETSRNLGDRTREALSLMALGVVAFFRRHFDEAEGLYRQALTIRRQIGDRLGEGGSLVSLGQVAWSAGDLSKASEFLAEALDIHRALGDRWWENRIWNEIGVVQMLAGDYDDAVASFQRGLALSREIGDQGGEAILCLNMGQALRDSGNLDEAEELLLQGLARTQKAGDRYVEAQHWSDLALLSLRQGEYQVACERASCAADILVELAGIVATSIEMGTLALAKLALGDQMEAMGYAEQLLELLNKHGVEDVELPQRGYWVCMKVLQQAGDEERARDALKSAWQMVQAKANRISDMAVRQRYLNQVKVNRLIIEAYNREFDL